MILEYKYRIITVIIIIIIIISIISIIINNYFSALLVESKLHRAFSACFS